MIVRAVIEKKIDEFTFRVRIPQINKARGAVGATPTDQLYIATVAVPSGIRPTLKSDDAVFVAFEHNNTSKPVIVGVIFNDAMLESDAQARFSEVVTTSRAVFPEDTTIGDVGPKNLLSLQGQTKNIAREFESDRATMKSISKDLSNHTSNGDIHLNDNSINGLKRLILSTSMFGTEEPASPVEGQLFFKLAEATNS